MILGFCVFLASCALPHRMEVARGGSLLPTESRRSPLVLNQEVEILPCGGSVVRGRLVRLTYAFLILRTPEGREIHVRKDAVREIRSSGQNPYERFPRRWRSPLWFAFPFMGPAVVPLYYAFTEFSIPELFPFAPGRVWRVENPRGGGCDAPFFELERWEGP